MATATSFPATQRIARPFRSLDDLLDQTMSDLTTGEFIRDAMPGLFVGLGNIWAAVSSEEWAHVVVACKRHPLFGVLDQDPFTRRARVKPRGYAGDAVMIDYIYRGLLAGERAETTELGQQVFEYTAGFSDGARAVRDRRDLLATRIDATAQRVAKPRILAVACGHLREAAMSSALRSGRVGTLSALDQDSDSLCVVKSAYGELPEVQIIPGSVRDLLTGKVQVDGFDLIYAAGLYDYLPARVARSLVTLLTTRLHAGGELLIGNFLPAQNCVGYMEAFMEWSLIWRSKSDVASLADEVPEAMVDSIASFNDATDSIAYLQLTRR